MKQPIKQTINIATAKTIYVLSLKTYRNQHKIKSARLPPTAPSPPPTTHPHNKPLSHCPKNTKKSQHSKKQPIKESINQPPMW